MEGENSNSKKKTSKGRKKIELKRVEKKEDRTSTFSKRKFGIHKKASEISTLCGAEVGFWSLSPSGNPSTFSTSDSIADRFLHRSPPPDSAADAEIVESLKKQCDALETILAAELELSRDLEGLSLGSPSWFNVPLDGLSLEQLSEVKRLSEESHRKIADHLEGRARAETSATASSSQRSRINPN